MLRRLEEVIGCSVVATDGEIGKVKDVLFDSEKWAVRHLVIDTGNWLIGKRVLVSPFAVEAVDLDNRKVSVKLSKEQLESAPSIATDEPVSRRAEAAYHEHFGWPAYWGGPGLWGAYSAPDLSGAYSRPSPLEAEIDERSSSLHSFNEVNGYSVHGTDGPAGDIEDMIIDEETWKLRYVVVDTAKYLPSPEVLVVPEDVESVVYGLSTVNLRLTREQVKAMPRYTTMEALNQAEAGH